MRTYDDTFSGQKIYPGKVRLCLSSPLLSRSLSPNLRRLYHPLRSSVNDLTSKWEGNEELMANIFVSRASSTSAATAKSSAFRTAKPSPSSCSARTLDELRGLCYSGGSTGRVLQR